ncbi:hypothetical protein [Mesobacillus boroniphilus]|uniref:Uncharacterized protein n=1 Tax=Mesobacillus boroniphilus JCM 21738 TaxID=1294265 RepID=W4RLK7_9BACI|nr:hypothetical protein [Mesobacillus boroniphilus]GAE45325.1 hypothetical protein JCM21738_2114 [Mesobacillus boroniphilus JCM 21738]
MLDKKILADLQEYIDQNLSIILYEKSAPLEDFVLESISPLEIETFIAQKRKPTLQKVLFDFIDKKGAASDSEIYKKAGIDRRHFSKIRSNPGYSLARILSLRLLWRLN